MLQFISVTGILGSSCVVNFFYRASLTLIQRYLLVAALSGIAAGTFTWVFCSCVQQLKEFTRHLLAAQLVKINVFCTHFLTLLGCNTDSLRISLMVASHFNLSAKLAYWFKCSCMPWLLNALVNQCLLPAFFSYFPPHKHAKCKR